MSQHKNQAINIGEREKSKRMLLGYSMLAVTVISYCLFLILAFPWRFSLSLILPIALMYFGFLQARASTCVLLAMRGTQLLDKQETMLPDEQAEVIKDKARLILNRTITLAILTTAFLCLVHYYLVVS